MEDIFNKIADITRPYYNTTNLTNSALFEAIEKATKQNERVMLIFKTKNRPMSASDIWQIYKTWFNNCPLTSIRRAISSQPELKKTGEFTEGLYGRPENLYVYEPIRMPYFETLEEMLNF
jgi:hypothetical protein